MGELVSGIDVLLILLDRVAQWSATMQQARAEGRAITAAEVDAFFAADDASAKRLADAIAKAKAEGR